MSDEEFTHTGIQLVGRHVPEQSVEPNGDGTTRITPLPGFYDLFAVIDGVPHRVARFKAGKLLQRIADKHAADSGGTPAA